MLAFCLFHISIFSRFISYCLNLNSWPAMSNIANCKLNKNNQNKTYRKNLEIPEDILFGTN